jgi:hypothetical protein
MALVVLGSIARGALALEARTDERHFVGVVFPDQKAGDTERERLWNNFFSPTFAFFLLKSNFRLARKMLEYFTSLC